MEKSGFCLKIFVEYPLETDGTFLRRLVIREVQHEYSEKTARLLTLYIRIECGE